MLYGGIEAGGTKMVCAIGNEQGKILDRVTIKTRSPKETIPELISYFKKYEIAGLGIGCFGPIDLNKDSDTYGFITKTPKIEWADFDMVGTFQRALQVPVGFDTDVNAAVLGEVRYGSAKGLDSAIYITIGTGVGVGVYLNNGLVHGLVHPEGGHILLKRHKTDSYGGKCPFHKNCLEGLASGPAIMARWGKSGDELSENNEVWELEAYYIGQAITNYILCYSPKKVILWGGVMHQTKLFDMVRDQVKKLLNGYVQNQMLLNKIDSYIVAPGLGDDPGIQGAIRLAVDAAGEKAM